MESSTQQTAVIVIGGGLVGLSAAMFLAWHDVPCILIEKHAKQSLHPRAIGYTSRTMGIFNAVGIADQIPQVPRDFRLRRVRVESLTGRWEEEAMPWNPSKNRPPNVTGEAAEYTPFVGAALAQDRLEPMIRDKARSLGADIRLGSRMIGFQQDGSGVSVSVATEDGDEYIIRAQFMIAADGHRSQVRETLGIETSGRGHLNTVRSVLFTALLDEYKQGYQQFVIRKPGLEAFLTTYGDGRWVLMFTDDVDRTEQEQHIAIRSAVGKDDLDFNIITTGRWELKGAVADSYQVERVFLAGDAAHTLPPTRGGYGANTGIHDVHNLAWKLRKRPVAWLRHQQTFARPDYAQYRQPSDENVELYDDSAIELGQIYFSDLIFDDESDSGKEPLARPPDQWVGRPGTRAPHTWLTTREGTRVSSLDFFHRDWMLVTEDDRWHGKCSIASEHNALAVRCVVINGDSGHSDDGSFCRALGLGFGVRRWCAQTDILRGDGKMGKQGVRAP